MAWMSFGIYRINVALSLKSSALNDHHQKKALICLVALILSTLISWHLHQTTHLHHLYWISLTVLVVLQASSEGAIKIALTRVGVNIVGALLTVLVMAG